MSSHSSICSSTNCDTKKSKKQRVRERQGSFVKLCVLFTLKLFVLPLQCFYFSVNNRKKTIENARSVCVLLLDEIDIHEKHLGRG